MTACPGICNAAWRATVTPQRPEGEGDPRPGEPVWCRPDQARIRRLLTELDDLAALLAYQADGHHEQAHAPARGNGHAPSPSPAADDLDELERTLLAWEDAYRDTQGWPSPPRRGALAAVTTTTVAWLTAHLDGILASPFAEDFGGEVGQWHRELTGKTRAGTGRHRKPVPCPRCGLRLLTWEDGDDYVKCGGCNRHMSMGEYAEFTDAAARHLERAG
jgi:hypothetical protein